MHTDNSTFTLFLIWLAVALVAQASNYWSIPQQQRTPRRMIALLLGVFAVGFGAATAWRASVDWSKLPTSSVGLRSGQLWNDGGVPAIRAMR